MKIVFLMAGEGRRFMAYDNLPKPLIKLRGVELIRWAVNSYHLIGSLLDWPDIYFITRLDHIKEFKMDIILKKLFSPYINIRYVEKTTRGPAETAMLLEKDIRPQEQVIISDCDMFFNALPLFLEMGNIRNDESIAGILPYVKRQDEQNAWSYVRLDKNNYVTKVNEKDVEMFNAGLPGIVGAYTFNRWKYFIQEAKMMIRENDLSGEEGKKEFYMSGIFKRLIKSDRSIKGVDVHPSWILGTPVQFGIFEEFLSGLGERIDAGSR